MRAWLTNGSSERRPFGPGEAGRTRNWKPFDLKPWRTEVGQGRSRRPRIDVFLTHWLTMKSEDEVSWQHLFDDFRKWNATAKPPVEELLADLTDSARIFDGFDAYPVGSTEQLFFYRLGVLESATAFPVVLWLFGPRGIADPDDRRKALHAIEIWLVRRMLRRLTTKNYNTVFLAMLKHLAADGEPSAAKVGRWSHLHVRSRGRGGDPSPSGRVRVSFAGRGPGSGPARLTPRQRDAPTGPLRPATRPPLARRTRTGAAADCLRSPAPGSVRGR